LALTDNPDLLSDARSALRRNEWQSALGLFAEADAERSLSGQDLSAMSVAAWFAGQADRAVELKERAFKLYQAQEDPVAAGATAVDLSYEYAHKGMMSVASAWLRRAEKLLVDQPETNAHGYLAVMKARGAAASGEVDAATALVETALRIGNRLGDADLLALARTVLGSFRVAIGDVDGGFDLLEEAAIAGIGGELSPFTTGVACCNIISACRDVSDYQRAREWTEATDKWCLRESVAGFPGICRVHRAEVVALGGAWKEAEEELQRATSELHAYNATPPMSDGFYAIGEIRLRKGDVAGAEEALRQAHALGKSPQPALAMLRLAEGKAAAAAGRDQRRAAREPVGQGVAGEAASRSGRNRDRQRRSLPGPTSRQRAGCSE